MERKDYPTIEVPTKYGTVTMTFLSPRLEMKELYRDDRHVIEPAGPLARVNGDLTINGIPLQIQAGYAYRTSCYQKGIEREKAVVEFDSIGTSSYNRRKDKGYGSWDYNAGYAAKVRGLGEAVLRPVYEAHPELAAEAERVYLHNVAADAYAKVQAAKEELKKAEKVYADACAASEGI